jgi:hypothetical protein
MAQEIVKLAFSSFPSSRRRPTSVRKEIPLIFTNPPTQRHPSYSSDPVLVLGLDPRNQDTEIPRRGNIDLFEGCLFRWFPAFAHTRQFKGAKKSCASHELLGLETFLIYHYLHRDDPQNPSSRRRPGPSPIKNSTQRVVQICFLNKHRNNSPPFGGILDWTGSRPSPG